MKGKSKVANEFRDVHGVYSKSALALSEETGKFTKRMLKKYNSELSCDAIGYLISLAVFTESRIEIALTAE